jgi:hypothetical protein
LVIYALADPRPSRDPPGTSRALSGPCSSQKRSLVPREKVTESENDANSCIY